LAWRKHSAKIILEQGEIVRNPDGKKAEERPAFGTLARHGLSILNIARHLWFKNCGYELSGEKYSILKKDGNCSVLFIAHLQ
jgi:hypothetical protein